jgi:hypothetical protein
MGKGLYILLSLDNMSFDISLYNDEFFEWHLKHARHYSIETMNWYIERFQPDSVVDFGCGIGSYLESCYFNQVPKFQGFDIGGEFAKKYTPNFLHKYIEYVDCTTPIDCGTFECVISFETIEHIEPSGTEVFIKNLVNATDKSLGRILFTGAPPEQEGCGHINCQTKEYWLEAFAKHNFYLNNEMTNLVKDGWSKLDVGCPNYIIDNLLILQNKK